MISVNQSAGGMAMMVTAACLVSRPGSCGAPTGGSTGPATTGC